MNRFLIFRIAIPLILFVITVNCNTEGKTFQESTVNSIDSDICMAVSEDIIAQMMEAERAGMTEIVLYVPEFSTTDNWPLATYANNRFSEHLWKYNILKHKIRIICVQPSMEKTKNCIFHSGFLKNTLYSFESPKCYFLAIPACTYLVGMTLLQAICSFFAFFGTKRRF